MNPNHSHITLLIDRSGSMNTMRADAEGAVNAFILEQKQAPGTASILLADFDGTDPFNIQFNDNLADITADYRLHPRGSTPLYDAITRGIGETGMKLDAMREEHKPSKVFFVIVTDGGENSSREATGKATLDLIKHHEDTFAWDFVFLANGVEAQATASAFAGTQMVTSNVVRGAAGGRSYMASTAHVGKGITARRAGAQGMGTAYGADVDEHGNVSTDA